MILLPTIQTKEELIALINQIGFLPYDKNFISGFSVEECVPQELTWLGATDGPRFWKASMISNHSCVYGKLVSKKAGFMSLDWYPYLACYRRNGYEFESLYEDGLATQKEKQIIDLLTKEPSFLSTELKQLTESSGPKGFDAALTRLQMLCYVLPINFEQRISKAGKPYGMGITRLALSDSVVSSPEFLTVLKLDPAQSFQRICFHLQKQFPSVSDSEFATLIH